MGQGAKRPFSEGRKHGSLVEPVKLQSCEESIDEAAISLAAFFFGSLSDLRELL